MKLINRKLAQIRPPSEVTRVVDSLDDISNWKASMFRSFGLYFYVALEDILPKKYFDHFQNLSYGIYVLLQQEVSVKDVENVQTLFQQFLMDMEALYGVCHLTINLHFLIHLPQCVIDWGCLWAHSTFIPEWMNGELMGLCHGTQYIADQMAKNFLVQQAVRNEATDMIAKYPLPPIVVSNLRDWLHLPLLTPKFNHSNRVSNGGTITLLGSPKSKSLSPEEQCALLNYFSSNSKYRRFENFLLETCETFERFRVNATQSIFTSSKYSRSPKRVNFCALLKNASIFEVASIFCIESDCFLIGTKLGSEGMDFFHPKALNNSVTFSKIIGQTVRLHGKSSLFAISVSEVARKCVVSLNSSLTQTYIVTAVPNNVETD